MTSIASRYGISDVAFKKMCARAFIPTPDRGHWAKKEAGKSTGQRPLPDRAPGQDNQVVVSGGDRYWYGGRDDAELLGPLPDPLNFGSRLKNCGIALPGVSGKSQSLERYLYGQLRLKGFWRQMINDERSSASPRTQAPGTIRYSILSLSAADFES
jgi:hypothetical protein